MSFYVLTSSTYINECNNKMVLDEEELYLLWWDNFKTEKENHCDAK
jgi:hypothetical protein